MFSFIFSLLFLLEFPPSSPWLLTVILGLLCLALNMTGLYCSLFQGDKCSSCPEGWIQHRRKCYHFTHERSSWEKSREYCSSHSSRLLRIENKEELDFINPLAAFHWIGLSRDKTYRPWMWGDELFSDDCKDEKRYICEQPALLVKPIYIINKTVN
uniref:Natural killer cells antigen CD94 n=1 Tax=Chrysemys picta bellii TaxID=8478 RepID=A0A8C3HKW5_CHRPI